MLRVFSIAAAAVSLLAAHAAPIEFNRDIRPILSDRCYSCHGPDKASRKSPLRLDQEASAKADLGKGRFAVVPHDPARSEIVRRITSTSPALRTPPELDSFLSDTTAGAYEKVVDRLLASPRYAERMAIRWLEAARYADTNGYQSDGPRDMWRWRDWVIDAFHTNMPFDRFTIEQIAGDLLPNATTSQRVATAFHRNH